MSARAAVVIGVNKTGGLNPLECAADNAAKVGAWLKHEGYKVRLLTDAKSPVHSVQVERALRAYVTEPVQFDLLLVYFSGHGCWLERSDRWLLSGAPTTSSDAINLAGAMDLAKCSGIRNVVFVSDACRTIPDEASGQRVPGIDAFPNLHFKSTSKVDYFKATSEARSAYEVTIPTPQGTERVSILTQAWSSAYQEATPGMILEVDENGKKIDVVPNRRLEGYLQPKVNELLALVDPMIVQTIEVNVPSADDVYISKVLARDTALPHPARDGQFLPTFRKRRARRGEEFAFEDGYRALPDPLPLSPLESPPVSTVADETVKIILDALTPSRPNVDPRFLASRVRALRDPVRVVNDEWRCGLAISGARVSRAESTGRVAGTSAALPEGETGAYIRVSGIETAASVAALLTDGRSFVLPAFAGYIGHVEVDDAGISNVSYVPSTMSERASAYAARQDELDHLRAAVADSVNRGRFQIHGAGASLLADAIRIGKGLDPSLGLYAAHAYSAAGLDESVVSVLRFMRDDLNASMYDVVMLASRRLDVSEWPRVPFCPLLTQAWNLLRPRGFTLHPILDKIRPAMQDSLWTTFGSAAGSELVDSVATGEFG